MQLQRPKDAWSFMTYISDTVSFTQHNLRCLLICSLPATRPSVRVLRGINLTVAPGSYVAIVGASGSGYVLYSSLYISFQDLIGIFGAGKARCRCKMTSVLVNIAPSMAIFVRYSIQLVERFYDPQAGQIFVRIH
jgi:ABC-type polysaccharide/polyol phosphate transport system ATPase subunit